MTDEAQSIEQLRQQVAALQQAIAEGRAARQESDLRYKALLDNLPERVFHKDRNSAYVSCNRNYAADFGLTPEQMVGKTDYDCYPPEVAEKHRAEDRRIMTSGETEEIEETYQTPGGKEVMIRSVKAALKDEQGDVTGMLGILSEITAHKRAEEALRESEERYRRLAESSVDMIYILDHAGDILYVNHSAAAYVGVSPAAIVGKRQRDLFPPEIAQRHMESIAIVLDTGELFEAERKYRFGGEERWLHTRLMPLRDEEGQIVSVMGVSRNITDRKRAEEALQKTHDELEEEVQRRTAELAKANDELAVFRRFAEASTQAFGMASLDGCITYVNPTMCRLLGAERPEDVVGAHLSKYLSETHMRRREEEVLPALMRKGHWQGDLTLSHQGRCASILQNSFLIRDAQGNPACLATVLIDITERKRAEEALRQSEEKYKGLVEACPDAVVMTDLHGQILFASRQTWRLVGLADSEELAGRGVFDYVIEEDRGRLAANISDLVKVGNRKNTEYTLLRGDGTTVLTETSSTAMRDAAGKAVAVMAVIRDITERKKAVEALHKQYRTLRHLLQSSDHERQLIAYEIHDGLAQQLAGAIMQFQTFAHLKEAKPKLAGKAYDAGMTMLQQGHFEARRLISGVRLPILDEEGIVPAIAHLVNEQRLPHGPKIEYHSKVNFDRLVGALENALYRIAQEGLTNACQHSKSETVRISLSQQEDRVRIEVRDWGIGFDAKAMPENRFGLEGIRQRARLLGGKFTIRSKPGKGTRITVELPVVLRE